MTDEGTDPQQDPLMWAHAAFDLMAVAIIYGNVEAEVAHLVFS